MILSYWDTEVPKNLDAALARLRRACFDVRDAMAARGVDIADLGHQTRLKHRDGREVMAISKEASRGKCFGRCEIERLKLKSDDCLTLAGHSQAAYGQLPSSAEVLRLPEEVTPLGFGVIIRI